MIGYCLRPGYAAALCFPREEDFDGVRILTVGGTLTVVPSEYLALGSDANNEGAEVGVGEVDLRHLRLRVVFTRLMQDVLAPL